MAGDIEVWTEADRGVSGSKEEGGVLGEGGFDEGRFALGRIEGEALVKAHSANIEHDALVANLKFA